LKNGARFKRNLKRIGAFGAENGGVATHVVSVDVIHEKMGTVGVEKVSKKVKKGGSKWN
jgi:hypothetical protein